MHTYVNLWRHAIYVSMYVYVMYICQAKTKRQHWLMLFSRVSLWEKASVYRTCISADPPPECGLVAGWSQWVHGGRNTDEQQPTVVGAVRGDHATGGPAGHPGRCFSSQRTVAFFLCVCIGCLLCNALFCSFMWICPYTCVCYVLYIFVEIWWRMCRWTVLLKYICASDTTQLARIRSSCTYAGIRARLNLQTWGSFSTVINHLLIILPNAYTVRFHSCYDMILIGVSMYVEACILYYVSFAADRVRPKHRTSRCLASGSTRVPCTAWRSTRAETCYARAATIRVPNSCSSSLTRPG